jgi:hypothetical protein
MNHVKKQARYRAYGHGEYFARAMNWKQVYVMMQIFALQRHVAVHTGEPEFLLVGSPSKPDGIETRAFNGVDTDGVKIAVSRSLIYPGAWVVRKTDAGNLNGTLHFPPVSEPRQLRRVLDDQWSPVFIPHLKTRSEPALLVPELRKRLSRLDTDGDET